MRVLIVEDDPLVTETLREVISGTGLHEVVGCAIDLPSAIRLAEATEPDLAFVDLSLANLSSGYEVAHRLNVMGIRCVFSTANPPSFPVPELCVACLTKPYGVTEVTALLAELASSEPCPRPDPSLGTGSKAEG